jgi:hypothetical protein
MAGERDARQIAQREPEVALGEAEDSGGVATVLRT